MFPSPADTAPAVSAGLGNNWQLYPTASDGAPRTMVAPRMHAHCARLLGTQFIVHPSTHAAHSILYTSMRSSYMRSYMRSSCCCSKYCKRTAPAVVLAVLCRGVHISVDWGSWKR